MMEDDEMAGLTRSSGPEGERDALLEALGALPARDLPEAVAERARMRGQAALARARRRRTQKLQWARCAYAQAEPVLVGALALIYLLLAVQAVLPQ